jgi:DNA-binding XRE family transcriptional regulator
MDGNGHKVKVARKIKGMNQSELADELGLPLSTYSKKEREGDFLESEIDSILKKVKMKRAEFESLKYSLKNKQAGTDDIPYIVNGIIRLEASVRVILRGLAEIHAHQKDQPATKILADYTTAVRQEISVVKDELKG